MLPALPVMRTAEQGGVRSVLQWAGRAGGYALPVRTADEFFRQRVFGPRGALPSSAPSSSSINTADILAFAAAHG